MEGTESLVEDSPIPPRREIETQTLARPKDVAARRDRPHDYHDDLPQSGTNDPLWTHVGLANLKLPAGAGPSRVASRSTFPSRSKKHPNDPSSGFNIISLTRSHIPPHRPSIHPASSATFNARVPFSPFAFP
jgi:hypothetical protein